MARKRYENYNNVCTTRTFLDLLRWSRERRAKKKDLTIQIPQHGAKQIKELYHNQNFPSITWIGHSTFLIQLNGVNILTDPVWSKRMGFQKRLTRPGIPIDELPKIDLVLISHGHYDHLSFGSIKKLKGDPTFFVPIGLGCAFKRRGYDQVVEADWWDHLRFDSVDFTFVPAQHWTRRTLTDMNTSRWGGWVIENTALDRCIYFVGDTGYFEGFKEIGDKFNHDIVLMPIGAYEPEWFMQQTHINPEDAIKAFVELKGKLFIPMHYGAYRLADDTGPEALERMYREWNRLKRTGDSLAVLKLGETLWLKNKGSQPID
ncbi:MBL fold metallo-hydrolase [Ammoniphilus oxalaticus]|uniref:MBL fold metallo-hydrolase n=1 Tax=Ammoniphilus oxalaticus TaxID=66863 RepID=A0A419SFV7_9BACL|nr:MBL fold metallo-hydrolase [Ammoniphilus oxalaticus]RKD22668.1 MBL fold metallo-hydrolase [Ammoniphilus oxalaticus]